MAARGAAASHTSITPREELHGARLHKARLEHPAAGPFNRATVNVSAVHYDDQPERSLASATALSASQVEDLRAALKRRFGREVELETAVDASLIGGAVIDAGDVVIDGSLKGKLARLQTALAG